jgi:hypothetical protein
LGRKRGFVSQGVVGESMEFNPVSSFRFPPYLAGVVIRRLILFRSILFCSSVGLRTSLRVRCSFIFIYYFNTCKISSAVSSLL